MLSGRGNHFEPEYVDHFFKLSSSQVLSVMESERGQPIPVEIKQFQNINLKRLIELAAGSKPKRTEEGLSPIFEAIYNAGLPPNYQSLD